MARRKLTTPAACRAEIADLAPTADWLYFTFYMGHVQALGSETCGEMLRRVRAADEEAAETPQADADTVRDCYLTLVLPSLPDSTVDGRRALLYIAQALRFCPKAKQVA